MNEVGGDHPKVCSGTRSADPDPTPSALWGALGRP